MLRRLAREEHRGYHTTMVALPRIARSLAGVAFAAIGCDASEDARAPRGGVVAEVHLHQWEGSSHFTAAFVSDGVVYDASRLEQLVNFVVPPVATVDQCALFDHPLCVPTCDARREFCSVGARCVPYEPLRHVDGGPVTITGGGVAPVVRLAFDPPTATYRSDLPFSRHAYVGGEALNVAIGDVDIAVSAPRPMQLSPVPQLSAAAPFTLQWKREEGEVRVELVATASGGESASIVCVASDIGSLRIPDELLAQLPPRPRLLRLDYERVARVRRELVAGRSVVVTAAAAKFLNGRD